jgi:hypothetical protein
MLSRRMWVVFWLILAPLLVSGAQPVFKNQKARDAKTAFEEEARKAEGEYNTRMLAAKRNYRLRLEQSKVLAMQGGDLEDANRIAGELKKVDLEIKDKDVPPGASRGLVIRKAMHGIGEQWADVTDAVRNNIAHEAVTLDGLPDPAPGKSKTTIVEGSYGGREFVISFNDAGGDPRKTFVFGQPSENVKVGR